MATKYRVTVSCTGVTKDEAVSGVPDILEEFRERPWHENVSCHWYANKLLFTAENDYDSIGDAVLDEFSDAVHACISWSAEEVHFAVESVTELVSPNDGQ